MFYEGEHILWDGQVWRVVDVYDSFVTLGPISCPPEVWIVAVWKPYLLKTYTPIL